MKLQRISQYVRHRKDQLDENVMQRTASDDRDCCSGDPTTSTTSSSRGNNDEEGEGTVVEEVDFMHRLIEEVLSTAGGEGGGIGEISLSSILFFATSRGRGVLRSPSSEHAVGVTSRSSLDSSWNVPSPSCATYEMPQLSILGDGNPLSLAWNTYTHVEEAQCFQQCCRFLLEERPRHVWIQRGEGIAAPPAPPSTASEPRRVWKEKQEESVEGRQGETTALPLDSWSIRKRLRSPSRETPEDTTLLPSTTPKPFRKEKVNTEHRMHFSPIVHLEKEQDDTFLVPLLFASESHMQESIEWYLRCGTPPSPPHSYASSSSSLDVLPLCTPHSRWGDVPSSSFLSPSAPPAQDTVIAPSLPPPPPTDSGIDPPGQQEQLEGRRTPPNGRPPFYSPRFPRCFPFGVVPLQERRDAALRAEASRLTSTLIRQDPLHPLTTAVRGVDVDATLVPATRPWDSNSSTSEDTSSSFVVTPPVSSSDTDEPEGGPQSDRPQLPFHLDAPLQTTKEGEVETSGDGTTYIAHGEWVMTHGRIHMRSANPKRKRIKKEAEERTEANPLHGHTNRTMAHDALLLPSSVAPSLAGMPSCLPVRMKEEEPRKEWPTLPSLLHRVKGDVQMCSPTTPHATPTPVNVVKKEEHPEESHIASVRYSSVPSEKSTEEGTRSREALGHEEKRGSDEREKESPLEEPSTTVRMGTVTQRRQPVAAEGGGSTSNKKKRGSHTTSRRLPRTRSAPLSAVSVHGVPTKTREEMKEILMGNAWPGLTRILREAFLIAVEEPGMDSPSDADDKKGEDLILKEEKE